MYKVLDSYIRKIERFRSPKTVLNYEKHIMKFLNWCEEKDRLDDIRIFVQEDYLGYLDVLKGQYASSTVHAHFYALYDFLKHCLRNGYINELPFIDSKEMHEMLPVVSNRRNKKVLTTDQVTSLIQAAKGDYFMEAVVRVFYDGGLRVSEVVNIKMDDISYFDDGTAKVIVSGKGRGGMTKERFIILSPATVSVIRKYKMSSSVQTDHLFVSERTKNPFTTRRIDQLLKKLAESVGIDITTHIFRKSVTTHLLDNGMPIQDVAEYLGHADINTTRNAYADLTTNLPSKLTKFRSTV